MDTELSEWNIKNIHALILKEINNSNAGKYRNENVRITGATQVPIDYINVPEEMEKLIIKYNDWEEYHFLIRAALLHGEFVFIHPFIDSNGRTARLLMNYEVLDKAMVFHDYTDFVKLVVEEEIKMLDRYLELIG